MRKPCETPEYYAFHSMWQRCANSRCRDYRKYGARGISVAPVWSDLATFLRDMGPRPSPDHSLERVDGTKGYGPDNCKWATLSEQNLNRRRPCNNTSGVKGVRQTKGGKWEVSLMVEKKRHRIYGIETKEKAIEVRASLERAHGIRTPA